MPGPVLFEEMLAGWRRQQQARRLSGPLVSNRERVVRRFAAFTGCWPWQWTAAQAESWLASAGWAHSTARAYQGALSLFLDYACDPRYGWVTECEQRAGAVPAAVLADLLHLAPTTAVRWMHQAGGDWSGYAAEIARTRNHQP